MRWKRVVLVGSVLLGACASAPPPDDELVVRLRVRDDLAPVGVQVGVAAPEPEPLCDPEGPDGLAVLDVAAGYSHGCAVLSDGRVRCWGQNWAGQLGDGTRTNNGTPTPVRDVDGAVTVGAGRAHSCALLRDGRVRCWGQNDHGQLGVGTRRSGVGPTAVDARLTGVAQLGVGWDHSCAVTTRGQVHCWGKNNLGQLGDGSRQPRDAPTLVRDLRATYVGAGVDSTCAVSTDGRVACWGALAVAERPRFVDGLPAPAVTVEVGQATACARLADGSVHCWGDGAHGLLGPRQRGASERPVLVEGLPPALTLAVNATRACITDSEHQLFCWGAQAPGIPEAGSPRLVSRMGAAEQPAVASEATCARVQRGGLCCFGDNGGGMLGALLRPFTRPSNHSELPVPMAW